MHLQNRGSNLFHQMIRYILVMTQLKRIQCSYVYNKNWDSIDEEKTIFTGSVFDMLEARCRKAAFDNP